MGITTASAKEFVTNVDIELRGKVQKTKIIGTNNEEDQCKAAKKRPTGETLQECQKVAKIDYSKKKPTTTSTTTQKTTKRKQQTMETEIQRKKPIIRETDFDEEFHVVLIGRSRNNVHKI